MKIDDEIKLAKECLLEDMKKHGYDTSESLHIVPASPDIRCFVPCNLGHCNCRVTIEPNYCIVVKSAVKKSLDDANRTLTYLNKRLNEL